MCCFLFQKSIRNYLQLIIFWNLYNKNFRLCLTTSFFLTMYRWFFSTYTGGVKNAHSRDTKRNVVQTNPPLRWCRVTVHYRCNCHPQSDCRCDCSLGRTRLTWVTVAMSTQSGDRHRLGSPWVVVFGWRVWVSGTVEGCRRVGVHGLHNALPRVATMCGWLAPVLGVNGAHRAFVFLSFPLISFVGFAPSQGDCHPSIHQFFQVTSFSHIWEVLFHT